MGTESYLQNTVGPFILRFTLAVIFIYHGVGKINNSTDWGASWATHLWQQHRVPDNVLQKLDLLPQRSEEEIQNIKEGLGRAYQHSNLPLPETLNYAATQMAVAWGEVVGGVALLLGLLTRLSALGMIIIQVGAIATVTWARGFSFTEGGGYEFNLALLGMCLAVALGGAGHWSVDYCLKQRKHGAVASTATPAAAPVGVR